MMSLEKTRAAFVFAAVLSIALAAPAGAQDSWVKLYENNERIVYFDRHLIEDRGDYIACWTRQVFSESTRRRLGGDAYAMILCGAKKGSRQIKVLQMATYDKDGKQTELVTERQLKQTGVGEWITCPPGSLHEWIWGAAMHAAGISF